MFRNHDAGNGEKAKKKYDPNVGAKPSKVL